MVRAGRRRQPEPQLADAVGHAMPQAVAHEHARPAASAYAAAGPLSSSAPSPHNAHIAPAFGPGRLPSVTDAVVYVGATIHRTSDAWRDGTRAPIRAATRRGGDGIRTFSQKRAGTRLASGQRPADGGGHRVPSDATGNDPDAVRLATLDRPGDGRRLADVWIKAPDLQRGGGPGLTSGRHGVPGVVAQGKETPPSDGGSGGGGWLMHADRGRARLRPRADGVGVRRDRRAGSPPAIHGSAWR
jgi:hypothetical protein